MADMSPVTSSATTALRLRVAIVGSDPQIWRLLEVDSSLTLSQLHDLLQVAFGWRESHLHQFTDHDPFARHDELARIGRAPRTWAPDGPFEGNEGLPEAEWTLGQVFDGFDGPLFYEYDFGDGWTHRMDLVERVERERSSLPAVLLKGERRGPLEDSGGVSGYHRKLAILVDPGHPEHEEVTEWVRWVAGGWAPFDPEHFDADHVNDEFAVRFDFRLGMSGLPTDAFPSRPKPAEQVSGSAASVPLLPADAAIVDLVERLPVPVRGELRGLLRRSGALDPAEVDASTAASMVEPFLWLLRRAGSDGIRLTQAGWLPPVVVSDAMRELGWSTRWIGKVNREDQTPPIANLREEAVRFGLLRKRNGVLLATTAGRGYLDDPLGLWRMLSTTFLRRTRFHAERDIAILVALDVATGSMTEGDWPGEYDMTGVLYGLGMLGWRDVDGAQLERNAIAASVFDTVRRLQDVGVFHMQDWRRSGITDGGRAFARAILRSPVP